MKLTNRYLNPTSIALFIIIIWDALKAYLGLHEPTIQLIIIGSAVSVSLIDNFRKVLFKTMFSRPASFWLVWIIYVLINTFLFTGFYPVIEQNPFVFISSIIIAYLFFLFIVVSKSDTATLINVLIFSYFCRLLLSFAFDTFGLSGSDAIERFGAEFNSNSVAIGALFLILLILLRKVVFNSIRKIDYFMLLLAIWTILATASKKTFIALIVLVLGLTFISRPKYIVKYAFLLIPLMILLVLGVNWSLNNTAVGERLSNTYEKTMNAREQEQMFDRRASYFIYGWELFKEHPINGIGLRNYMYVNKSAHVLHTEYMIQLAECGLIGSILFVLFYWYIIKGLLSIRRKVNYYKKIAETHLLALSIIFSLFFGAWSYNIPMMWVLIALAVRFSIEAQEQTPNSIFSAASAYR